MDPGSFGASKTEPVSQICAEASVNGPTRTTGMTIQINAFAFHSPLVCRPHGTTPGRFFAATCSQSGGTTRPYARA